VSAPTLTIASVTDRMAGHLNRRASQPLMGVKRKLWRKDDEHADIADQAFDSIRTAVLQRDMHACCFCHFRSSKYQEVHHLDDDHQHNVADNLVTVCTLCHQVFHVGLAGMRGAGYFAVLPELTQAEVNHIVRTIYVAELFETQAVRDKYTSLLAIFESRGSDLAKRTFVGTDFSQPLVLAPMLSEHDDIFNNRHVHFQDLRLVATREAFKPDQLQYYVANMKATFQSDAAIKFYQQLVEQG
jgi:intracellular multiplication protein IcmJ